MPEPRASAGLLTSIVSGAARLFAGRMDGAPPFARPATASAVAPAWRSVMDCAPGGCGGGPLPDPLAGSLSRYGAGLDRETILDLRREQLLDRIVRLIVDDALSVRPTLAGDHGELTPCVPWLEERGFFAEANRAMSYARGDGGGGVVCFVDDGRPASEEVDLLALRDAVGFYALSKWNLVPDGPGSGRIRAGWYGQRIGRPEHYLVSFPGLASGAGAPAAGSAARLAAERARDEMPRDVSGLLARSGYRFHRSRVIAWPFRDDLDLQQARRGAFWNGWGPGVVEAVLEAYLARTRGAAKLGSIMNSAVVNTMTIGDLEARQSTPDYGALVRARLDFVKWCRDYTGDSVPIIATDESNKFGGHSHNVAGIDKLVDKQRQFLLDVVEYPGVVLFGDSVGGMNGGDRKGEWRAYAGRVAALQSSWVWTAGSFGGGLRQAVMLAMGCRSGPTRGRMDPTVAATWPAIVEESADDRATTRLRNAQARAQDRLSLGLTGEAVMRYDPTVREDYPGLDVDEGPLPTLAPTPAPGHASPSGTTPALSETGVAAPATTPGATNEALAGEAESGTTPNADAPPPAPLTLPDDIRTEKEVAAALGLTTRAFRRWVEEQRITTYPTPAGTRGGDRYSLGEVLGAWQAAAIRRADAAAEDMLG